MAETPPIRKFMFDRSFDGATNVHRSSAPRAPVTLRPEQLDALKKEAYDQGFAAGKVAGVEEHAHLIKTTLGQVDQKISHLMENFQAAHKKQDEHLRQAILSIARKLLPEMAAQNGLQEIQAMLSDAIAEMVHEPRLVVRVHESQFDAINEKINDIAAQKAYAGKVVVLADPETAVGDCRIEWADGGMERNVEETWRQIEQTVAPETQAKAALPQETTNG